MDIKKQELEKSELFDEIEWEKPINRSQAGNVLIVGGSPHGFAVVGNSFEYCEAAGAGRVKIVMPISTKHAVEEFTKEAVFLPATVSGSFSKKGLSELKALSLDAWVTLMAGDFGRNSETALLVEGFLMSSSGKVVISKDAMDFASTSYPGPVLKRDETVLVASLSQLQRLLRNAGHSEAIEFSMSMDRICKLLRDVSVSNGAKIVTAHHGYVIVIVGENVSITKMPFDEGLWQTRVAAYVSVYWMQHESKPFKAITSAVYHALKN